MTPEINNGGQLNPTQILEDCNLVEGSGLLHGIVFSFWQPSRIFGFGNFFLRYFVLVK